VSREEFFYSFLLKELASLDLEVRRTKFALHREHEQAAAKTRLGEVVLVPSLKVMEHEKAAFALERFQPILRNAEAHLAYSKKRRAFLSRPKLPRIETMRFHIASPRPARHSTPPIVPKGYFPPSVQQKLVPSPLPGRGILWHFEPLPELGDLVNRSAAHAPDGTQLYSSGAMEYPDGTFRYPCGTARFKDRVLLSPDGRLRNLDGSCRYFSVPLDKLHGRIACSDGSIFYKSTHRPDEEPDPPTPDGAPLQHGSPWSNEKLEATIIPAISTR
jgi:hypothetical protein